MLQGCLVSSPPPATVHLLLLTCYFQMEEGEKEKTGGAVCKRCARVCVRMCVHLCVHVLLRADRSDINVQQEFSSGSLVGQRPTSVCLSSLSPPIPPPCLPSSLSPLLPLFHPSPPPPFNGRTVFPPHSSSALVGLHRSCDPVPSVLSPGGRSLGRAGLPLPAGGGGGRGLGAALPLPPGRGQRDQLEGLCAQLREQRSGEQRRPAGRASLWRRNANDRVCVQVERLEVINKQYVRVVLQPGADPDAVRAPANQQSAAPSCCPRLTLALTFCRATSGSTSAAWTPLRGTWSWLTPSWAWRHRGVPPWSTAPRATGRFRSAQRGGGGGRPQRLTAVFSAPSSSAWSPPCCSSASCSSHCGEDPWEAALAAGGADPST